MASDPTSTTPAPVVEPPVEPPTVLTGEVLPPPTPNVSVGPSTVAGGGLSLAAFIGAGISFAQGNHDPETIALLASGVVVLLLTLGGRYAQAVAAILTTFKGIGTTIEDET